MTTYYAIGGGNWADATLNGGQGGWNDASDGSGDWSSGNNFGTGDVMDLHGQAVTYDVVTDQTATGGSFPPCKIMDSVGGGSLTFSDTTSSGTPITLGDGTIFDSTLTISNPSIANFSIAANAWVQFSRDIGAVTTTLSDGAVCAITTFQSGAFTGPSDGGITGCIFVLSGVGIFGGATDVSVATLLDPSTVSAGTTYAIASGYGGPGGMVGTATAPGTPDASSMLNSYTYEGVTGNVVMPTEAQVKSGVTFGPSSGSTGSYAGASGLAASPLRSLIIDAG